MITEGEIVDIGQELFPHVEDMGFEPTFFDVTTTMAFMHFREEEVERAVVEVGLGGRLDSTNVLDKVDVCAITSIGLEHTDVLGTDIPSITVEKASIIKKGSTVVVGDIPAEGVPVVNRLANERKAKEVCGMADLEVLDHTIDGLHCRIAGRRAEYEFTMPVLGRHQAKNAAVAIAALEALDEPPDKAEIEMGLSEIELPGRMEILDHGPLVMVDGAHNPAAGAEVAKALEELFPETEIVLVIGMMKDKDMESFLRALSGPMTSIIATKARSERAIPPHKLEESVKGHCGMVSSADNVREAMQSAIDLAGNDGVVLATGSFYVAGEVRQIFRPVEHVL
jgi:dihydrofolate synthase/folylpolyglutamate synthase